MSLPGAFAKVLRATFILAVLFVVTCYVAFGFSDFSHIPWLLACFYSLGAGMLLGMILGVLRVIATALINVESILRIILDITGKAAKDYEQIQTGEMRMPTAAALVGQVYDDVIVPVLDRVVAKAFGFLSTPILWAYRRTIGGAVRYLIKRVQLAQVTEEHEQRVVDGTKASIGAMAQYSDSIQAFTSSAAEIVAGIGRKVRAYALTPLYVALVIAIVLATIPLVVMRYLGTPAD